MNDILRVDVFQALGDLLGVSLNGENIQFFLLVSFVELALLAILHEQVEILSVAEALIELDDVFMLYGVVQEDFAGEVVEVSLRFDLLGVNHLERGIVALLPVLDLVHETVCAPADDVRPQIIFLHG